MRMPRLWTDVVRARRPRHHPQDAKAYAELQRELAPTASPPA